jgi:hypothetical protein
MLGQICGLLASFLHYLARYEEQSSELRAVDETKCFDRPALIQEGSFETPFDFFTDRSVGLRSCASKP